MIGDFAETVKDALRAADPAFDATLFVDDDFRPAAGAPVVLVADDGGPSTAPNAPWLTRYMPRRPILRLTAYAVDRPEARAAVIAAAEFVAEHKPGIARVEDIPSPLLARDRKTGAELASIAMPVIVRQTA